MMHKSALSCFFQAQIKGDDALISNLALVVDDKINLPLHTAKEKVWKSGLLSATKQQLSSAWIPQNKWQRKTSLHTNTIHSLWTGAEPEK